MTHQDFINKWNGKHQVYPSGWVGAWKLNESSGTRLDSTRNSNDLTDTNTVTSATGKLGTAAQFTRANSEKLTIADNASLSMSDIDFHVFFWVYLDTKSNNMDFVSKWNDTGNQRGYTVNYLTSADRFRFFVSSNGTDFPSVVANNFGGVSTSQWIFVHAWHDASANTINISANNGTADSTSHSAGVFDNTAAFDLGQQEGASLYHDGRIDTVAIYKGTLSTDFRTTLYNNQNSPSTFATASSLSSGNFFMFL